MKVKRGKKDFWTPAAPLRVDGADPKARLVRVSPLWSTAAWSTATAGTAGLDLSYGASQLWSTSAGSTSAVEHCRLEHHHLEHPHLEHPTEDHRCLEHHCCEHCSRGAPPPWSTAASSISAGNAAVSSHGFCKSAVQQKHDMKIHI